MYNALADLREIDSELEALADEMETISIRIERLITENATVAQDQDEYKEKYGRLEKQFESAKRKYAALEEKKAIRFTEAEEVKRFADLLRERRTTKFEFTEALWNGLIDHVTVYADEHLVFAFKNGKEVSVLI